MELSDVEVLLHKYYLGSATEHEENQLKQYFTDTPDLPLNLKSDHALFNAFIAKQQEVSGEYLSDEWLFKKIPLSDRILGKRRILPVMKFLAIAASIVFIIGAAFWMGMWYNESGGKQMSLEPIELQEMKQVLLAKGLPSDRIWVTNKKFDPVKDEQVIDILIRTLNRDPNVNVRLAACEALFQFKENTKARKGLIASLMYQTDPMVQISLIEILSDIKDRESFLVLEQFITNANLHPIVREKAEDGLFILRDI